MRLKKDGTPDGRTGSAMARKPKQSHPWAGSSVVAHTQARERAKASGFIVRDANGPKA
jgi:hypothetical protein